MSDMQVHVALRETREPHHVLHHVFAADEAAAAPFIAAWTALGSTRAGRTEVVTHAVTHPDRPAELDLHDLHPQPGQPGLPLPAGVDGYPVGGRPTHREDGV